MSDFSYPPPPLEAFQNYDYLKQHTQNLEFSLFHSPCDLEAPPPEFFEVDIDSGLEGFEEQLQLLTVSNNHNYSIPRGPAGPLSTLTTSGVSESASDDIFSDVSSFYGQPTSNNSPTFDFSQIEMQFQRARVGSDYGAPQSFGLDDPSDPTSFGQLPPTPPRSPPVPMTAGPKGFAVRSSYSDYGPPSRRSAGDIFSQIGFNNPLGQNTVSPLHLSTQLPPLAPPTPMHEELKGDPRKKYKCPSCPRGFARAYNLKTHMATHDPNRLKPHVCPHRSCGRSFSRKHDLGRHLVSIHRDETLQSAKKAIGVGAGNRNWCDTCGKGSIGPKACDCHDIK
ncbi:hypothetical protein MD484_g77, partial [Candolleomyces efflorescens]